MKLEARNFRFVAFVLAVLSVMTLASLNMFGQATSGILVGTVFDASGAAVVGADVEATNVATNATVRAKSNGTGEYRLDNLLPGTYHVSVRAQGFKAFAQTTDVQLNKTGTINVTLTPGAATETVEVSGAPPIIDTTTPQLGTTYEVEMLKSIPTAGTGALGVINLSLLQAGVGSSGGLGAGTGPAVGGQRPRRPVRSRCVWALTSPGRITAPSKRSSGSRRSDTSAMAPSSTRTAPSRSGGPLTGSTQSAARITSAGPRRALPHACSARPPRR